MGLLNSFRQTPSNPLVFPFLNCHFNHCIPPVSPHLSDDRVGVVRKRDGTLHFFVNGVDQGQAAINVPANVYGVIDLYGQAAQASLIEHPVGALAQDGITDPFRFHSRHGANARITNGGFTATRPHARGEFNDAIVISHRALRDDEVRFFMSSRRFLSFSDDLHDVNVDSNAPSDLISMCHLALIRCSV